METPILIYPFKRPDLTKKVLDNVMKSQPQKIFIAVDAPREYIDGEIELVFQVRKLIDNYNFESCKVEKLYLEKNIGIDRIHEVISWFFEHNETGIVLEDDIVPNISFFNFVDELLEHYKNNGKVKFITGSNFISHKYKSNKNSYHFTNIPSFWGWATWRNEWQAIDFNLVNTISENDYISILKEKFTRDGDFNYFKRLYDFQRTGSQIGGDQKIMFNVWAQKGVCIVPSKNLISNIGINHEHANSKKSDKMTKLSNLETEAISNIIHPDQIVVEKKYDNLLMDKIFNPQQSIITRGYNKIKRILRKA